MHVLIIKNISSEGPGTIGDYLKTAGIGCTVADLSRNQALPGHDAFTHLVVLGGPMAVYEMDRVPYLRTEAAIIRQAIDDGKHVFGICLGAQMIAHVLGARVYPGGTKEIGWQQVTLSAEGMRDPAMSCLSLNGSAAAEVFQWHGDTFDLPEGAVRLASSGLYPNQAFRYADRVYALQFHIEVNPGIVAEWMQHETDVDRDGVNADSARIFTPYHGRAVRFYQQFFGQRF